MLNIAITGSSSKILSLSLIYGAIVFVMAFVVLGIMHKSKSIKEYLEDED